MACSPKPAGKPARSGGFGAKAWASIAAVLGGAILIFEFIATEPIQKLCCAPKPKVTVTVKPNDWSGECLKFAFENLPSGLAIARIRLNVTKVAGPNAITGNPTADIKTVAVSAELPRSIFTDEHPRPIEFDVNQQASMDQDTLFVNYCPTLNVSSQSGKLTVQPDFLSPVGSAIKGLTVALPDDKTITFTVSRPTYLDPKVDPKGVK